MSEPTNKEVELQVELDNAKYDIECYKRVLTHTKHVLMTKVFEYSQEILKLESAISDPKPLFSGKAGTA